MSSKTPSHGTIYEAQMAVMQEVAYIQKSSIPGMDYPVVTEESVIREIRPAMIRHGLTMRPIRIEQLSSGDWEKETKYGSKLKVTMVRFLVEYEVYHIHSHSSFSICSIGECASFSDKASAAAMTMAQKYALLELFLLERGVDPDIVVKQRDEPNAATFSRSYSALQSCRSPGDLEKTMERIRKKGEGEEGADWLSDSQISELEMFKQQFAYKLKMEAAERGR